VTLQILYQSFIGKMFQLFFSSRTIDYLEYSTRDTFSETRQIKDLKSYSLSSSSSSREQKNKTRRRSLREEEEEKIKKTKKEIKV